MWAKARFTPCFPIVRSPCLLAIGTHFPQMKSWDSAESQVSRFNTMFSSQNQHVSARATRQTMHSMTMSSSDDSSRVLLFSIVWLPCALAHVSHKWKFELPHKYSVKILSNIFKSAPFAVRSVMILDNEGILVANKVTVSVDMPGRFNWWKMFVHPVLRQTWFTIWNSAFLRPGKTHRLIDDLWRKKYWPGSEAEAQSQIMVILQTQPPPVINQSPMRV